MADFEAIFDASFFGHARRLFRYFFSLFDLRRYALIFSILIEFRYFLPYVADFLFFAASLASRFSLH